MASNTSTNPAPEDNLQTDNSGFLKAIQDKLLGQSGAVSSTNSELQTKLESAIAGVSKSAESSNKALESQFGRELGYRQDIGQQAVTAGRAAGSGGILNLAALRELTQTTDKSLKDLEQRKQELILQNDAQAASKIAELQFSALEFKQRAEQQTFSNLLGLGNFNLSVAQEERASRAANEASKKILGDLISENPQAKILATDTLDEAYTKIGKNPNSPEVLLKKAQIDKIYNDIKTSGTGGTENERKNSTLAAYEKRFVYGAKLPDGTPIVDDNGYITPKAFKAAIKDAPSEGVSRKDFIEQFGYLLYSDKKGISSEYGLTAQEKKLITGYLE